MAYYNSNRINSFADAEARYNSVKPLRGKFKDHNVRPLGDRRQQAERIKKINDDCYILLDWGYADDVFRSEWYEGGNTKPVVTEAEQIMLAPIVWQRHPDGTETVKVRNATDLGQANGRYKMLQWYLPSGLSFNLTRQGEHSVICRSTGSYHWLNLSRTVTQATYDAMHSGRHGLFGIAKVAQVEDDGVALTFRRTGSGSFEYLSGGTQRMITRTRINKELKAPLQPLLDNLFTYCLTMRPLLNVQDYEYNKRMQNDVADWLKANNPKTIGHWGGITSRLQSDKELLRTMLTPEHDMYLYLAFDFMHGPMSGGMPEDAKELSELRASFNSWANKVFGFQYEIQEAYDK